MTDGIVSTSYLPPDARERLLAYVYAGEDRSYVYKHFWRPLCQRVVRQLPVWLAPNVITVSALLFVSLTHTLIAYHVPKLTVKGTGYISRKEAVGLPFAKEYLPPPPGYVFVLAALALFSYQLLDNLDGFQARRTGMSSPLGLLMDHGCDAVNCIIASLSIAATVSAGPCWKTWLMVLSSLIVFFMNTWEEYYRGELILPVINGPNEGIILVIFVYLWTAWIGGPQWWYDNAVEVPSSWLPAVLRQSAPEAAAQAESMVLRKICPFLTLGGQDGEGYASIPFFLNLNCSDSYIAHPTLPVHVNSTAAEALYIQNMSKNPAYKASQVIGKQWEGHSFIQRSVLALYGNSEEVIRVRYNTLAVVLMCLLAVATCLSHMFEVFRAIRKRRKPGVEGKDDNFGTGWLYRKFPFLHALTQLTPLVVITVMSQAWYITSHDDIFRRHPRIFCWTVGLLFTKVTIHVMLSHLCGVEFRPFRRTFLPFLLFGVHISMGYALRMRELHKRMVKSTAGAELERSLTEEFGVDEELVLYEFFAISVITFAHLVWTVVRQVSTALDVPLFTVPREHRVALLGKLKKENEEKQQHKDLCCKVKEASSVGNGAKVSEGASGAMKNA